MLKNYFKIAIAVLKRRKFFTFISLFGISLTLTILLLLTAFIDKVVTGNYPDKKRDRSLYVTALNEIGTKSGWFSNGALSFYFLDHFAGSLKTPVRMAISSNPKATNTYVHDRKISLHYKYTNAAFWEVTDYDFLEGKAFSAQQVAQGELVTVISEDTKKEYFGDVPSVVGKYIEADNVQYRVCGVVKNVPATTYILFSDIYLPYTVSKKDYRDRGYMGDYTAILLAASKAELPKMREEYEQMMKKIPMENKDFDQIYSHAESYAAAYVSTGNEKSSGMALALLVISAFVLLVTLVPALNLVNINITRIMERSSEIGIRKAFGASSRTLVFQFIVENLILTLLGGVIGVLLSYAIIQIFNGSGLIPNLELSLNFRVLLYGLLACLFFGLLSGVYPAWRMSKMKIVNALKAQ